MSRFVFALRNLFRKKIVEKELQEEIQFHMEMQIQQNRGQGMTEEEARRQASLQVGGVEQTKERVREVRTGQFVEILLQDVRYSFRSLRREPGFLAVAILTLSVGIGANTAIFSLAQAVLLQPLPYPDSGRLAMLWQREKDGSLSNTNYATVEDWKQTLHSFSGIAATSNWQPIISGYGDPEPLEGMSVSSGFFKILGIPPMLGRDFQVAEDRPDRNRVVILTHRLWKQRFNSDPSIIGRQILLNGIPRTVVGVMPSHFQPLIAYNFKETEIFRPLGYDQTLSYACRSCNHLQAIGRIRAGSSIEQAGSEIDSFTRELIRKFPNDYGGVGATLVPLREHFVGNVRTLLWILLGAVAVILLIGCSNLASLMLSRGIHRSKELGVRAALGAGRIRLLRQLLTESMLLALIGGTIGILFARWGVDFLIAHAPIEIPRLHQVSISGPVLLFAIAVSLLSGILFGLVPALRSTEGKLWEVAVSSNRISDNRQNLRRGLVAFNIALALVLLAGVGLLLQTVQHLMSQKLGFQPEGLITMTVSVTGPKYDEDAKVQSFFREVLGRVQALPAVQSAGVVSQLPLTTNLDMYGILVKDKPVANEGLAPSAQRFAVSPDYLKAMRIPLLSGRFFSLLDGANSLPVVIVNRTFADRIWPGENPIGKQIHIGEKSRPWRTVIGVAEDVRHIGLQEPFAMQFYMPLEQWSDSTFSLVARVTGDSATAATEIRRSIRSVDPGQSVSDVATMEQVVQTSIGRRSFTLHLLQLFALTALFLAALGIYGVMAYGVSRRFHEIGIRMALGANRNDLLMLLLGNGIRPALGGIVAGIAAALVLTRFLQSLLFGLKPTDPLTLITASLILFGVSCVACFIPAFRASRSNPALVLRYDF